MSHTSETLKAARDIAWVIKTLWVGLIAVVGAAIWVASLAAEVELNSEKIQAAATQAQIVSVAATLERIEGSLEKADVRQREMKSQLDRVVADVNTLKENAE